MEWEIKLISTRGSLRRTKMAQERDNARIETLKTMGFLFGHYDSRGGAMFIPETSFAKACTSYAEIFGLERNDSEPDRTTLEKIDVAYEDFLGEYELVAFDEDPREETELDWDYGGKFTVRKLKKFWWDANKGRWREVTDYKGLLLHTGPKPTSWEMDETLRYRYEPGAKVDLGEDAWGLAYGTGL